MPKAYFDNTQHEFVKVCSNKECEHNQQQQHNRPTPQPIKNFSPSTTSPDGYNYYCKACQRLKVKESKAKCQQEHSKRAYEELLAPGADSLVQTLTAIQSRRSVSLHVLNRVANSLIQRTDYEELIKTFTPNELAQQIPIGTKSCYHNLHNSHTEERRLQYTEFEIDRRNEDGMAVHCKKCQALESALAITVSVMFNWTQRMCVNMPATTMSTITESAIKNIAEAIKNRSTELTIELIEQQFAADVATQVPEQYDNWLAIRERVLELAQ